jgi:hypothetical protein
MAERTPFETRLEDVLARYADSAPTVVDAASVAHAAASSSGTAGGLGAWLFGPLRVGRAALLLALVAALLVAALLAGGALRAPAPDSPVASRTYVSDDETAWVLDAEGQVVASGTRTGLRSGPCGPTLIGGTNLLAGGGFRKWEFSSLTDEPLPRVRAAIDYAGGERWSPDRVKVAMMDFAGTLEVLDFSDPSAVAEPSWSVPGILDVAWAPDSERMLIARGAGTDSTDIELMDIDDAVGTTLGRVGPEQRGEFLWSPDGRTAALIRYESGETAIAPSDPLPVLLRGDVTLLGPIRSSSFAAWSPTGDRLALVRGGDLVVVDGAGIENVMSAVADDVFGELAWAGEDALVIRQRRRLLTVALEGPTVTVLDRVSAGRAWAIDGSHVLVARSVAGGVDLMRYRGGSGELLGTRQLRSSSPVEAPSDRVCLDVQPLG